MDTFRGLVLSRIVSSFLCVNLYKVNYTVFGNSKKCYSSGEAFEY